MAVETNFICQAKASETLYRLRPNPDAPIEDGYSCGAVLEWSDDGGKKWDGYFYIAEDCLADMAKMFALASDSLSKGA